MLHNNVLVYKEDGSPWVNGTVSFTTKWHHNHPPRAMHHIQVCGDVSKNTFIMPSVTKMHGASKVWKLMPVVSALRRLKQENCLNSETRQDFLKRKKKRKVCDPQNSWHFSNWNPSYKQTLKSSNLTENSQSFCWWKHQFAESEEKPEYDIPTFQITPVLEAEARVSTSRATGAMAPFEKPNKKMQTRRKENWAGVQLSSGEPAGLNQDWGLASHCAWRHLGGKKTET